MKGKCLVCRSLLSTYGMDDILLPLFLPTSATTTALSPSKKVHFLSFLHVVEVGEGGSQEPFPPWPKKLQSPPLIFTRKMKGSEAFP